MLKAEKNIRVGVIGVGRWGLEHLAAYRGLPNVGVIAIADSAGDRVEEVGRALEIPHRFTRYEELCALAELDAVSIVTPESEHLGPVLAAARSGKHILVEKPLATNAQEVQRMIEAATEAHVILMPGHILRFEPRYALIKEKLVNGELGTIVSIQARRNRTKETRQKYARAHPVFAAAIHDIDILLWYTNTSVRKVRGFHRNVCGNVPPDVFWGIIEFDSGAIGVIECTWLIPDAAGISSDDLLHVITDRGVASVDFVHSGLTLWKNTGFEIPDASIVPRIRNRVEGALAAELSYFVSCVARSEAPTVITAEDALTSIRVASALVESAEKELDLVLR